MAAYDSLKSLVQQSIRTNGNNEITGQVLQNVLMAMIDELGGENGYAGVATPSTNPGAPDGKVFYFATEAGTYTHFDGATLAKGIHLLVFNGVTWSHQTLYTIDSEVTSGSNNLITSGAVYTKIINAINALDATVSKSAGADGLSLSLTEVDGKVTNISGSIAPQTYDAYGAASEAKTQILGDAASDYNTLGKLEDKIQAEASRAAAAESALNTAKANKATTLAGYGINDAYTKTEVNGLVSTPHQNYVTVPTYASLPATGSADTIYRVSNYNGSTSQVDASVYSEYAWNGSGYTFLRVVSQIGEVFDITVYNSNTKYADLAAALGTNGANVPSSIRRGGMSVKFVQSSDNKYVQYRLMSDSFNTTEANWQGVDDEPIAGSDNLVKSDGILSCIDLFEDATWENKNVGGAANPTRIRTIIPLNKEKAVISVSTSGYYGFRLYKVSNSAREELTSDVVQIWSGTIENSDELMIVGQYKDWPSAEISTDLGVNFSCVLKNASNILENALNKLYGRDSAPVQNSTNLVNSGALYNTLKNTANGFVEEEPVAGSTKIVFSGGVADSLNIFKGALWENKNIGGQEIGTRIRCIVPLTDKDAIVSVSTHGYYGFRLYKNAAGANTEITSDVVQKYEGTISGADNLIIVGQYKDFPGQNISLAESSNFCCILKNSSYLLSEIQKQVFDIDNTPTQNSTKFVDSGSVYASLKDSTKGFVDDTIIIGTNNLLKTKGIIKWLDILDGATWENKNNGGAVTNIRIRTEFDVVENLSYTFEAINDYGFRVYSIINGLTYQLTSDVVKRFVVTPYGFSRVMIVAQRYDYPTYEITPSEGVNIKSVEYNLFKELPVILRANAKELLEINVASFNLMQYFKIASWATVSDVNGWIDQFKVFMNGSIDKPILLTQEDSYAYKYDGVAHVPYNDLYSPFYPYYYLGVENDGLIQGIYSKYPLSNTRTISLTVTNGSVTYVRNHAFAEVNIGELKVAVVSIHGGIRGNELLVTEYTQLLSEIGNYQYVIIGGDTNIANDANKQSVLNVFLNAGYKTANFGYWGTFDTWEEPNPAGTQGTKKAIDTFFVKGFAINSFKVINNSYKDHSPIISNLNFV